MLVAFFPITIFHQFSHVHIFGVPSTNITLHVPQKATLLFLFCTLHNHTYIENAIKYYSIQLWIAWQRRKEFTVIFFCFSLLCFCFGYFMFCRLNMCSCVVLQVVHSSRVNIKFASLLLCGIVRLSCMGLYMNNMWIYIYLRCVRCRTPPNMHSKLVAPFILMPPIHIPNVCGVCCLCLW